MTADTNRHFGMDVIRASAILCVIIGHAPIFFHRYYSLSALLFLAMFGVELFFVLSGFLIGHILLELASQDLSLQSVRVFWLKRWFRTLPAYLFVAVAMMLIQRELHWTQLVFLQNWFPDELQGFPASWSLAVEEWFYLSFPLLLLAIRVALNASGVDVRRWLVPAGCALFILVPWVLRGLAPADGGSWDLDVRKQVPLRLDAIAYGVLLAWWHERRPELFRRAGAGVAFAGFALPVLAVCWVYYHRRSALFAAPPDWVNSLVFLPLVTWGCVAVTAFHIRFARYPSRFIGRLVLFTSVTSYSLYLVHLQVFTLAAPRVTSVTSAWGWFLVAIGAMALLAWVLHRTIERPFMKMRDRFDPRGRVTTHLTAAGAGGESARTEAGWEQAR